MLVGEGDEDVVGEGGGSFVEAGGEIEGIGEGEREVAILVMVFVPDFEILEFY